MRVAAKTAYTSLRILLVYECNANVVYFDGVQLFNASGQRISKTVNGTTYNYHYLGDQLVEMAWGANRMHFTYDAVGPLSVNFNGTEYFYLKNAQGDVTGLVDSAGAKVVHYTYDPWGESWGVSGTLASTLGAMNPLRYRGYVYDTETGLYYLNTRYYNPTWGRFINADAELAGIGGATQGYSLFAYCHNNPVNMSDSDGNWPKWLTGAANAVSGVLQMVAGAAVGTTLGWTGIGAVAAGFLMVNGAATATQGIGQVVNSVSGSRVLREDNIIRTGVQAAGNAIGGQTGAMIAGVLYVGAVIAVNSYSGYAMAATRTASNSKSAFSFASRGSTGRTEPLNLREQLAMAQVKSNPYSGVQLTKITMRDPRWPAAEGWVKMQQIVPTSQGNVTIHYVYNQSLKIFDDFKFTP